MTGVALEQDKLEVDYLIAISDPLEEDIYRALFTPTPAP
jgi:hypothetical protein|tara:strand:- start:346 stop:462 length:117 start_codon:yes stop_codon:yes gene_type:complete